MNDSTHDHEPNPDRGTTWSFGPNGERIPYPIVTDAGKQLWVSLNNRHGSATWGEAGELIPLIEQQSGDRILEQLLNRVWELENCIKDDDCATIAKGVQLAIAIIEDLETPSADTSSAGTHPA